MTSSTLRLLYSAYNLDDGEIGTERVVLQDSARFNQKGGTHRTSTVSVGAYSSGGSAYTLDGGLLLSSNVTVGAFMEGCNFFQN